MATSTQKTRKLTQLALLIALEGVLWLTPLGLIMIPPIAMTTMHIPVIIAAILLGPTYGAIVGASFGLMSLFKATMQATSPIDMLFSPVFSEVTGANPFASLILCVVTRIMLGLIAGWLFILIKRYIAKQPLAIGITAALSTIAHTLMVLGCMYFFFSAVPLQAVFSTILTLNGILETIAAVIISIGVVIPLMNANRRQ